ncbi:hypothetical protein ACHAXT_010204 [Thalassiosira profunda]
MTSKSSFSAFKDVDESVAKPVLGSDGAARWQDFRGANKLPVSAGSAPHAPMKKLDRALGTKSIKDERATEAKVRREAGDREAGSGYTVFKRKSDHEENAERKRKKLVLQADEFEGYKFDYVFTTQESRGTGYYWDGTDSMRKELGLPPIVEGAGDEDAVADAEPKKEKKRKKKRKKAEVPEADQFNPMEQVAQAMMRREQAMGAPLTSQTEMTNTISSDAAALGAKTNAFLPAPAAAAKQTKLEPELVAAGWECTKDPTSGKTYYFRRSTDERSWTKPAIPKSAEGDLPPGWKATKDATSGKAYYYHTSGKTSWEKPKA